MENELRRPKVGVGAIIVKDAKVLLKKRANAHGDGTWSFTGGHLEWGETPEACAFRETHEEAGIAIANAKQAAFTNDFSEDDDTHYVTLFVVADWLSGEAHITEPDVTSDMGWFTWDELPRPLFQPIESLLKQGFRPEGC